MENRDVRDEGYYDQNRMKKIVKDLNITGLSVSEIAEFLGMEVKDVLFLLNN